MLIKCISTTHPRRQETYTEITLGKEYLFVENIPKKQLRIVNDLGRQLVYPRECFTCIENSVLD